MSRPHVCVCVSSESARGMVFLVSWVAARPAKGLMLAATTALVKRAISARLRAGFVAVVFTIMFAAPCALLVRPPRERGLDGQSPQCVNLRSAARTRGCRVLRLTIPERTGALL